MSNFLDSKTAFKETLPTVLGYIGISAAFGIIAQSSGLSVLLILLISIIDYAGAAQFVIVTMLLSHSPFLSIVLSVFLVNSRLILMSTTLTPYFKNESLMKNIFIGTFLTDESFALGMNKLNYTNNKLSFTWFNSVNLVSYVTWVIGTFIGATLGSLITHPEKLGLNFAITAMFIGLLYLQMISDQSIKFNIQLVVILITLIMVYIGLIFIPANLVILLTTVIVCYLGTVIKHAFK
ncbi:AzlC family ABC transporter permease [Weissella bombi]|uniref:4-azaleucine resistance probable transporter AzlC n=1 Tax=Weissella bombi TaxID=1505725 RepID=A0A1C3YY38_9LACO|nr:AzlC family ABC transporter permease [Weissella bombi]SCB75026.1 4-azaleucine resistance probable transporter AzlC [Weissella bombi]